MKSLYELKEMLCEELDKIAEKGELSAGSLETIHKLTDTIKNIDKIEMFEDGGYSEDGGWSMRGGSYAGGGGRRGRGGSNAGGGRGGRGGSYDGGDSYANRGQHYVRGHYSRDDGREYMMEQLESMMREAGSEKEREALRRCMTQLENA